MGKLNRLQNLFGCSKPTTRLTNNKVSQIHSTTKIIPATSKSGQLIVFYFVVNLRGFEFNFLGVF